MSSALSEVLRKVKTFDESLVAGGKQDTAVEVLMRGF